ncbi:hypothetical protein [Micromonospora coxensis]|uniref:hypothetical protein n=1 Tax=Micromonospora coxensis TaxID=356852 RepID=UPI003418B3C4
MAGTWTLIVVTTAALLGTAAAVMSARRRRMSQLTPMERARQAMRELGREERTLRRSSQRGDGEHFGRTRIRKYGDERHADEPADSGYHGDSYSDSGGGSSV